ncbi:WXG100 family type VII secretion target [Streptomyces olivoverticillatus]|uniref:WXG100 family type VII secretion target n=1 Tax=Streptomyces olivoverticillatus TaxID=66427 RepID=A0A7W7PNW2_9ACTN|nr:WXG100 family type VII secretion target [Streptomyces olivoverticillatus]MBB4895968.1 WXG100 family type VII secretion target [Streptomyces olivoverticillatus]
MGEKLRLEDGRLNGLANDLGTMHDTLEGRIAALNAVVDSIEGHWKGIAANAYNGLQRQVNDDVRRLKELLAFTKEAIVASDRGFTQEEHERLNSFKGVAEPTGGILNRFNAS